MGAHSRTTTRPGALALTGRGALTTAAALALLGGGAAGTAFATEGGHHEPSSTDCDQHGHPHGEKGEDGKDGEDGTPVVVVPDLPGPDVTPEPEDVTPEPEMTGEEDSDGDDDGAFDEPGMLEGDEVADQDDDGGLLGDTDDESDGEQDPAMMSIMSMD